MKNISHYIIIVITTLFVGGFICCYILDPYKDMEYFEGGYVYKTTMGYYELFRSGRYVGVKFVEDITPEKAEKLAREYLLTPVTMMDHEPDPRSWDEIHRNRIIIMRLANSARLEDYLTNYPRAEVRSFGDLPEVQFCLPTFSSDKSGKPESRVYINDEISASSHYPIESLKHIVDEYGLEVLQETDRGDYYNYKFRITHNSPMYTLDIANELFDMELFRWAAPVMWVYSGPGRF